jgi:hypothetical protein
MAGHSKFKNIMYRKGAQDKKRSALFSKLSREITVAAKMGLPDPDANARLRAAIIAARAQSMPKDNIQRAIDKASGSDAELALELIGDARGELGPDAIGPADDRLVTMRHRARELVGRKDGEDCERETAAERDAFRALTSIQGVGGLRRNLFEHRGAGLPA